MKMEIADVRYTRQQAATLLGVSYDTVIRAQRKGLLLAEMDHRGNWRIAVSSMVTFANGRGIELLLSEEGRVIANGPPRGTTGAA